jgi:hypothetical protein
LPKYQVPLGVVEQATGMHFNLGQWQEKYDFLPAI